MYYLLLSVPLLLHLWRYHEKCVYRPDHKTVLPHSYFPCWNCDPAIMLIRHCFRSADQKRLVDCRGKGIRHNYQCCRLHIHASNKSLPSRTIRAKQLRRHLASEHIHRSRTTCGTRPYNDHRLTIRMVTSQATKYLKKPPKW